MNTSSNPELQLAGEYIRETGCNIFLTGKAGTGKTTFLHSLKADSPKRMVVTAPTGVAAINAGGVTLHSFFQLPFGPFIPGSENPKSHFRFSKDKIGIIKSLDLLVIDEISMVRADLLDGVDAVLRRFRRNSLPFGGVQLLMIGDLFQLPPVVKNEEWQLLNRYYSSPYFFSSNALAQTEMATIELKKIYRQADSHFIDILNMVRNSSIDSSSLEKLNSRAIADFSPSDSDGYITLCTHNRSADIINTSKLEKLSQKLHRFEAEVEGEFPDHTFPTASTLHLKKGAQVMFVRNDLSYEKRYFNGKIGTITHISAKEIRIKCPEDRDEIEVEPATWENIEYSLDQETQEITEKKIGAFCQYPLRLAWAITIHKSQGLTFDRAIIDAQAAFAHGQVYVALSRCRTLEGMVLSTPLSSKAMKTDAAVLHFSEEARHNLPTAEQLGAAQINYQQRLLLECFNFQRLRYLIRRLVSLLLGNQGLIHVSGVENISELQHTAEKEICAIGDNFQRQLRSIFQESLPPVEDPVVLERIAKASGYFQDKITAILAQPIENLQIDTDNKELRKKSRTTLQLLEEEIEVKLAGVLCCKSGFSPSQYFRAVSAAAIPAAKGQKAEKKKPQTATATYSESDITHQDLFVILKEWRGRKAKESAVPHFQILHQKTLIQIAVNLPDSLPALKNIKGIGKKLAEKYGDELVEMVCDYRRQNNIEVVELPLLAAINSAEKEKETQQKPQTQEPALETKKWTLELFKKGLSLAQIAKERQLTLTTIEKHMAHHVETGKVPTVELLSQEKLQTLEPQIKNMAGKSLREIKEALTTDASYSEILIIRAHLKYLSSLENASDT